MICPQCKTANDDEYVFCVNCGATIGRAAAPVDDVPATIAVPRPTVVVERPDQPSQPTVLHIAPQRRSKLPLILGLGFVLLLVAGVGGFIAYRVLTNRPTTVSVLPDHLGLFWKKPDGSGVVEVKKQETANLIESRDVIAKDSSLPQINAQPELILYADAADIPISDLKFIRLDSISDDGKVKHLDFQAAIVDEKPAMKRIKFAQPLSDGKYAFALVSGFANEGRHRLWPVEVKAGATNGAAFTQELALNLKPVASPTPSPTKTPDKAEPPVGATVAYVTRKDVWLRKSPAIQDKGKLSLLKPRQKVFVIRYSENSDTWEEITSNWALVQTESGKQGWVFNAFLDHGK
jgi:hypothetical protein